MSDSENQSCLAGVGKGFSFTQREEAMQAKIESQRVEIEQLHAAAREVIDGQQDRHKHSSGQVFVDVGSLDALARLLPTKDNCPKGGDHDPMPVWPGGTECAKCGEDTTVTEKDNDSE